jgi:hypothetical protein
MDGPAPRRAYSLPMRTQEIVWAAGFFNARGRVYLRRRKDRAEFARVSIGSVYRESLERFQRAVGIGHIRGPYVYNTQVEYASSRRSIWRYNVECGPAVRVLRTIRPYLRGPRGPAPRSQ